MMNVSQAKAPKGYKALVTGVAGFIGSHVAKDCLNLGFEVVGVDDMSGGFRRNVPDGIRFVVGDLKNAQFVSDLMEKEKFDVVYHLAAYAAEGLSHFIRNYNYQNNLVATTNLITQSVRTGSVKKFVFTSSIATYGSGRTPMTEDMEPLPEDPYGVSKLACEYDLRAAYEMFGLQFVIFRPHNVYGPGQNMYDKYRNVVGIFLNQLQAGKNLTVFGDGAQTRKFSYITDVSFPIAVSGVLEHVNNQVFNVGGDIATTVNELALVTSETWGNPGASVVHLDSRNEVAHAESDHAKLNCYFPGLPRPVGLRVGMQRMVRWAKATGKYFRPVAFRAVEVKRNMPPSWVTSDLKEVPALHHDLNDNSIEAAKMTSWGRRGLHMSKVFSDLTLDVKVHAAEKRQKKPSIFYFGVTHSSSNGRVEVAKATWADPLQVVWYSNEARPGVNHVVSNPSGNAYDQLTWRMMLIWKHVYENYKGYDWYARVWDDNYIIQDTFESLVKGYSPDELVEIGRLGRLKGHVFVGGGAGSLLSRAAMKLWSERIDECRAQLQEMKTIPCAFACEDVLISRCRSKIGIRFKEGYGLFSHSPSHRNVMNISFEDIACRREGVFEHIDKGPQVKTVPRSFHYVSPTEMTAIHRALTNSTCHETSLSQMHV